MPRTPTNGLICIAALDMRQRPDHRSELTSQLLMGESVAVLDGRRNDWWQVENLDDGYRGWVRTWGVLGVSRRAASQWRRDATARIRAPYTEVRATTNGAERLGPLFWNTPLTPGRTRGRFREIKLPGGKRGLIGGRALTLEGERPMTLAARVRGLLGTPYLWGGRTPLGIDCSGFSQQVMAEQNVRLPRDAEEQYRAARPLRPKEPAKQGDLVFFGPKGAAIGHVGVMLGPDLYAHSRGTVRISSMDSSNHLWDKELAGQMRGVRRFGPRDSLSD